MPTKNAPAIATKTRGRPFQPGNKASPGRPKKTQQEFDLAAAAKLKAPEALTTILEIMDEGESHKVRLQAAEIVLDRAFGKARQAVDTTGSMDMRFELIAPWLTRAVADRNK